MLFQGSFTSDETQIDRHAFEVVGARSIHITLCDGAFEHVLVIVREPSGAMRALLTYKTHIRSSCLSVAASTSDNGTIAGPLPDGAWAIEVVRTYPVTGRYALRVETNLGALPALGRNPLAADIDAVVDERIGWYRGDFHAHSIHSDGRVSHREIADAARRSQLDFYALTDHSIATTKMDEPRALVLPSTEVTWDDAGHYNIHGLRGLPDHASFLRGAADKSSALDALFRWARSDGCVLSINHPFTLGQELRHDFDIRSFRLLEVINAPHLLDEEIDNERAVHLFDFLWSQGHLVMGVGGSDAHKKSWFASYPLGLPQTMVWCEGLSVAHVLDACARGRSYIQSGAAFDVALRRPGEQGQTIWPGERVRGPVECKARCDRPVNWEFMCNGEIARTGSGRRWCETVEVRAGQWWRLQARADDGELLLFANPVHDARPALGEFGFQALLERFRRGEERQRARD